MRWRGVVLPAEHGGWGLTLEPVVLGMAVAPGWAGAAVGLAAVMAFLARTPIKVVGGDLWRRRRSARFRSALVAASVYGTIAVGAIAAAVGVAQHRFWPPLAAAVPLVVIQVFYDLRGRGRRLVPEVGGPLGMGSVAAAIALAGGGEVIVAMGLWLVLGLRVVPSVLLVRAQLRRARGQEHREWPVHAVAGAAAAAAAVAAAAGVIPVLGAAAIGGTVGHGLLAMRRAPAPVVVVGIQQTVIGALVVAATVAGVRTGI
jgi:hypothetical protein